MNSNLLKRRSILSLVLLGLLASTQAHGKDPWTSVKSKNFNLIGNASEKEIKQVATKLEQFREVFSRLFPNARLTSAIPSTVIVFKSNSSFKPFKPVADGKVVTDVAGYFQGGPDVNYITLTTETASENPYRTIFHEYVHLLVNNMLGRAKVPTWFNEGLAEYYSTFEVQDSRKVSLGKPIANHLYLLRSTKLWPLKLVFEMDRYSLERNKHDARGLFYAQSWALVHYLIQGNEGKRVAQFGKLVQLLMSSTPVENAFQQALNVDYVTLEKELKSYIQRASYRINVATFERRLEFDADMQTASLSAADAQAYLGDLLLHMDRSTDAVVKLEEALTLESDHLMAHSSMGMALLRQKNFGSAKAHLQKALNLGANNYLAHYYYAYLLSREGMDENSFVHSYTAENAALIRTHLAKSIQAKPDFGESYRLLATVNLVMNENLDEALQQINKAIVLAPGSEDYVFILAQIYLRKEDAAAARKVIEPLASSSSDPRVRANAQAMLKGIMDNEERVAEFEKQKAARSQALAQGPAAARNEIVMAQSDAGSVANSPYSYLEEALRKPGAGEVRLQGTLLRINCTPKAIIFTLKVDDRLMKFSSSTFDDVDISTFTTEVAGELTCGPRKATETVVITYSAKRDARAKTDGTSIALEFVPRDFKLSSK